MDMDEKELKTNGGKRLASKGRKGWIALLVILALLAAAYVGLCVYTGMGARKFYPNTTALGVDVSGLTQAQAREKVSAQAGETLKGKTIELRSPTGAAVTLDVTGALEEVEPTFPEETYDRPFLLRGAMYLKSLVSHREVPVEGMDGDGWTARRQEALKDLSDRSGVTGRATTYKVEEDVVTFEKGVTGRAIDPEDLEEKMNEALAALLRGEEKQAAVEVTIVDSPPEEPDFEAIRAELLTEVSDAAFDPEKREIIPSVTGRDLNTGLARQRLSGAGEGQVCRVPLTITEPELSTEELESKLFKDTLGEAVTKVTGTNVRVGNIRHAASFVNEQIVMPGEEFSFNKACSPYTEANGYGKATAYVGGLSKDTVAGGICQVSSTLYWASLKANLTTVERYAHAYYPSYITGGLDATVYGDYGTSGSLDFRFLNSTEYPIRLTAYVDKSLYLHVTVQGTDTTGIHGEPYSTNKVITKEAQTIYEPREDIPQGTTQKDPERTAYNGATIDTYQKLVDASGKVVEEKKLYTSKYAVRNAVIWYNPADAALWGIDPATGLKLPEPVTPPPTETPAPEVTETPAPAETPAPVEPSAPAESDLPVLTPPPVDPDEPLLPPGTETTPEAGLPAVAPET